MTTSDPTAVQRMARYRLNLRSRCMVPVNTWVPTRRDAALLLRLAQRMRDRAETNSTRNMTQG